MENTRDAYDDFSEHDRELQEWEKKLPVCSCCGNRIQELKAIKYNDEWCCSDCEEVFWDCIKAEFMESTRE